ncbi:MAG TPA: type II toxin-antitoxin system RelE/ParE family toxin [Candidatus Elarobacter sp.]|nr:type II toxin-antitoxin system RelE/ParE family toxin [Candidatus Elarobacter sp.]
MRYRIEITKGAERDLRALPQQALKRVDARILALTEHPRPDAVKNLAGAADLYRVRVGDYRVIYEIQDRAVLVIIVRVRHRGEAYR